MPRSVALSCLLAACLLATAEIAAVGATATLSAFDVCASDLNAVRGTTRYNTASNTLEIVFGPDGRMVTLLPEHIDADDTITVKILAPESTLPHYSVEVVAGAYTPTYLNIYRGDDAARAIAFSSGESCKSLTVVLGRFTTRTVIFKIVYDAPGGKDPDWERSYTLPINPLYHGTVRLAIVRTELDDETFGLFTRPGGASPEIFVADQGDRKRYVIQYVPFVLTKKRWAGRDLLKRPSRLERLNFPVIGLALEDPDENVFVGLDVEVTRGIALSAGAHYGKHTVLAEGFQVGSPFMGSVQEIPTREVWDVELYYGLSLDLMIVSKAFKGVLSAKP